MTRDKEIDNAKNAFYKRILEDGYYYDPRDCFEEGADWADANPKSSWISVKDSLPKQDEEVIVLRYKFNCYNISFAHIVDKTVCKDYNGWNVPDVVYWFPMLKYQKQEIKLCLHAELANYLNIAKLKEIYT